MSTQPRSAPPYPIPRSIFVASIFYGGMVCIAGVLGSKLVALGPLAVEAGIFAFLLLIVTSSAIADLHGRKTANALVLLGFIPLVVSTILIRIVLALPPAAFWEAEKRIAFDLILDQSSRMMIAGMIAYVISQLLNVYIFTKLKRGEGSLIWLRALVAGVLSQTVDTLIFITIAFYGVEPIELILPGQLIAKITLSAVFVPPLVYAFLWIGRRLDAAG